MSDWRVIITDGEDLTGVAPVCPQPDVHAMMRDDGDPGDPHVYDECCVGPHIECGTPRQARRVAIALTAAEAEICS